MSAASRTNNLLTNGEWRPGADLRTLRTRATMLAELRRYFAANQVLEVETPLAGTSAGTDPSLEPLTLQYRGPLYPAGKELYLQTSPEFAMKRLLAAGSGPIYQVCKAFRNGEAGRLHNPEFTILEWYRPGFGVGDLMDEVAGVLRLALAQPELAVERHPYDQLLGEVAGCDALAATAEQLRGVALQRNILGAESMQLDADGWLDLLFSHLVQPHLGRTCLTFVTDYPASQAALAQLNPDGRTAARFEVFHRGVELANGFLELSDVDEQAARFEADNCHRRGSGRPPVVVDRRLLAALQHGLPDCAGVAVGLDRVLLLRIDGTDIDEVISFSLQRC